MTATLKCDIDRFAGALAAALETERGGRGIGTLGERTLHAVLKNYFEPRPENHEIKIGRYVADIVNDEGITEIQTRSFDRLRAKLAAFSALAPVTVVCPVVRRKTLVWIDPESGEMSKPRKSPKNGRLTDALRELCRIHEFIGKENIRICIILLDCEEYRMRDGWANDGKRGSTRYERIPTELVEEIYIETAEDLRSLLPSSLPSTFTAANFRRAVGFGGMSASFALKMLVEHGIIIRSGKSGKAFLYSQT